MFTRISDFLIHLSIHTPYFHIKGYMRRYWLVPYTKSGSERDIGCGFVSWSKRPITRLIQYFGIAIRIHHILRSDDDRAFHDHPWPYLTIILRGGYIEHTPIFNKSGLYCGVKSTIRRPGSILFRSAKSWHRLEVIPGADCWTLFCTGKYVQTWGFLTSPEFKTNYRKYLGLDES